MNTTSYQGQGTLVTPGGPLDVAYRLTVTRAGETLEGFGHVEAGTLDFAPLIAERAQLDLGLEQGGRVRIEVTDSAGSRALFTALEVPDFLLQRSG